MVSGLERDLKKKGFRETREHKLFLPVQSAACSEPAAPLGGGGNGQQLTEASHTQSQAKISQLKGRAWTRTEKGCQECSREPQHCSDTFPFLENPIYVFFQLPHCKISWPSLHLCSHLARKKRDACIFLTKKASLNSKRQGNCFRS